MHQRFLYLIYHYGSDDPKIKIIHSNKYKMFNWLERHDKDPQFIEWEIFQMLQDVSCDKCPSKYVGTAEDVLREHKKNRSNKI